MDGVIADFMGSLCKVHGREIPYSDPACLGKWDTEKLWGISETEFWAPKVAKQSPGILGDHRRETPEADEIMKLAVLEFGIDNVCILTAPSKDAGSVPGKRAWISKYYPCFSKKILFATASAKQFCAGPGKYPDRRQGYQCG